MSGHPLRRRSVVLGPAVAHMWHPARHLRAVAGVPLEDDPAVCACDHVRDLHTDRGPCVAASGCTCTEWRPV